MKHADRLVKKWLAVILSIVGLVVSLFSYFNSTRATKIAFEAKNINRDSLGIQIDKNSLDYVSNAYDEIYYNTENSYVMRLLRIGSKVNDIQALLRVIDVFEGVGSAACQGNVKFRHIRPYFYNTLGYICDNKQSLSIYGGKKNGLSILCHELYPNSGFAKCINFQNIGTCEFFDSISFPITPNRYRFEVK